MQRAQPETAALLLEGRGNGPDNGKFLKAEGTGGYYIMDENNSQLRGVPNRRGNAPTAQKLTLRLSHRFRDLSLLL